MVIDNVLDNLKRARQGLTEVPDLEANLSGDKELDELLRDLEKAVMEIYQDVCSAIRIAKHIKQEK